MSGPIWRYERSAQGTCAVCLADVTGLFVEGEIRDDTLHRARTVCAECYRREGAMLVSAEAHGKAAAPAYAHR